MCVLRALLKALLGGANVVNARLWTAAFNGHTAVLRALVSAALLELMLTYNAMTGFLLSVQLVRKVTLTV